jgi:putative endonuclease
MAAWFYVLRLKSGTLYPGATKDVAQRLRDHASGRACRTTRVDLPTGVVYREEFATFTEARRRESQVKRWSRDKKEALIAGDLETLKRLSKRRSKT